MYSALRSTPFFSIKSHMSVTVQKNKGVWSGNNTITNRRPTHGTLRKRHKNTDRHNTIRAKQAALFFISKIIVKQERTPNTAPQTSVRHKTPTANGSNNKNSQPMGATTKTHNQWEQQQTINKHMCGSRGGDKGSGTPLKNHKNIGFLSNTGPNPLKIHKAAKINKGAKIRNRYNQVPHLTQDTCTNGKVTNSQLDTTNENQEVSPFLAGYHKARINRRAQRHSKHKTEQKHKRSTKEVPPWNGQ